MAGEWPFPPIRGVISTQTMRPDGTLLTELGYDPATGFVLFEPPPMPAIPAAPTKADALEALKDIDALFDEFPFANTASRSVALSLDMSLILRPAMTVVPLHVTNAPEGGTGKSYIFDVVSVHSVGEKCPAIARGSTYEETEKRLIGAGLEGRSLILLDNCNGELRSEFLCQAVERPLIKPRPLGTSVMPTIPNGFVCGANGNNIEISEDLVRRTLQCSLDANMEQPYLRSFKRNPVHDILADRGKYVAAVLTIARAYIQAGRPDRPTHLASFEEWSDLVRGSLIWLGRVDPVETIAKLSIADPVREQRAKAFAILSDIMGESFAVPDVIRASKDNEALSGALLTVVKSKKGDEAAVSPDSLGWWLRRNAGRIADGYKLIRNEAGRWSLVRTKQMHSEDVPF
jgi:putative DNA primase/helicase